MECFLRSINIIIVIIIIIIVIIIIIIIIIINIVQEANAIARGLTSNAIFGWAIFVWLARNAAQFHVNMTAVAMVTEM